MPPLTSSIGVLAPTWEKVGLLAAIVAVRVVLSWILLREIDAARAEAERGKRGA